LLYLVLCTNPQEPHMVVLEKNINYV
jgi:hypothetical protein